MGTGKGTKVRLCTAVPAGTMICFRQALKMEKRKEQDGQDMQDKNDLFVFFTENHIVFNFNILPILLILLYL